MCISLSVISVVPFGTRTVSTLSWIKQENPSASTNHLRVVVVVVVVVVELILSISRGDPGSL